MISIHVLGTGCEACDLMAERVEKALGVAGKPGRVTRVTDVLDITAFKVAVTPALVIDGIVRCSGRVPEVDEIITWLLASSFTAG